MRPQLLSPARLALAVAVAVSACSLDLNRAWADPAMQRYALPAQPLDQALRQIARQSASTLVVDPGLLRGRQSAAVNGQLSAEAAVRQAVAGSGLQLRVTDNGTLTLEKADSSDALQLGATSITGSALGEVTENTGSYTTASMATATKFKASARETPQSVTVVTRQRMDDQNMQTLDDIASYTPGLTLRKTGGERPQFYSRGAAIDNIMVDGLPIAYDSDTLGTATLAMFDRVEVVRGASGLMVGSGNPSGTLNLVRKRPTLAPQITLTAAAGSWDNYRTEIDASSSLNDAGTVRGRVVGSYQDKNSFTDAYSNQRQLLYGITEFDLSDATTLTLGGYYNREDNPGADWNGSPTHADGSFLDISRSSRFSPDWTYWDKTNKSVFAEVEHRLDNDWRLRLSASWLKANLEMLGSSYYRLDPTADELQLNVGRYSYEHTQKSIDGYASGPFSLFGRTHELVVGASYRRDDTDDGPGGGPDASFNYVVDPNNFHYKDVPRPAIDYNWSRKGKVDQSSAYTAVRFNLRDDLKLILGSRLDWYEYQQHTEVGAYAFGADYKATREVTPYAGLIYDLNDTYSVYTSWTRIFKPQEYQNSSGGLLAPVTGTNYEAGLKAEYFGGALNASFALFQLDQENLAKSLPAGDCPTMDACYEAAGEIRTRGLELELGGELAPGWQASAGYTYAAAEYVKATGSAQKGDRFDSDSPYNLFKLATSYQLPGDLDQWSVGGAFRTQSRTYTSYSVKQGGYSVVDLMTQYRVTPAVTLQTNLNNVADKRYYQSISNPAGANIFGEPRNVMFTVKWSL
ncbi:TonB-dependent siderophore receptor [Pseudomonas qingdaonensis]|uniref:TonB-dependent siderophore receptor n=1 Tax=Pseudomonas qingdaonensis TaxID=2056231 RepID=UPI0018C98854|nr:TonB-dependent receptor [Pseudomonas qingdaonensis]MBG8560645.1 TonB-dependent siderophore receptor [Pseudomonas qingdaonensis]